MIREFLSAGTVLLLAACSAGLPPTIDADAIEADRLLGREFDKLAITARADLPRGRATYDGALGAQITGDFDGRMIGDLTMTVDFADDSIGGRIRDLNITDRDGVPTQALGGDLVLTGLHDDNALDGRATGDVRLRDPDGGFANSRLTLELDGNVRSFDADGDAVAGQVAGTMTGDVALRVFDGYFYGQD